MNYLSLHPYNYLVLMCKPVVLQGLRMQEDQYFVGEQQKRVLTELIGRPQRKQKHFSQSPHLHNRASGRSEQR